MMLFFNSYPQSELEKDSYYSVLTWSHYRK